MCVCALAFIYPRVDAGISCSCGVGAHGEHPTVCLWLVGASSFLKSPEQLVARCMRVRFFPRINVSVSRVALLLVWLQRESLSSILDSKLGSRCPPRRSSPPNVKQIRPKSLFTPRLLKPPRSCTGDDSLRWLRANMSWMER